VEWEERTCRSTLTQEKLHFDGTQFMVIGRQIYECLFAEPRKSISVAEEVVWPFCIPNRLHFIFGVFCLHKFVHIDSKQL